MRDTGDGPERNAPAAFLLCDPQQLPMLPRELRIAAIVESAPRFPMEEVAEDLMLKMQGGLRGYVGDRELN
ncbi:MAG TPA: hypothetical protein VLW75_04325 [Rhizomicrobium sp.]|nr:hypothetical protein [Rhizomicrobium sp.]